MNTIPRLFENPTWETIASFSGNELAEFVMLAVLSLGLVAGVIYGVWLSLRRR